MHVHCGSARAPRCSGPRLTAALAGKVAALSQRQRKRERDARWRSTCCSRSEKCHFHAALGRNSRRGRPSRGEAGKCHAGMGQGDEPELFGEGHEGLGPGPQERRLFSGARVWPPTFSIHSPRRRTVSHWMCEFTKERTRPGSHGLGVGGVLKTHWTQELFMRFTRSCLEG